MQMALQLAVNSFACPLRIFPLFVIMAGSKETIFFFFLQLDVINTHWLVSRETVNFAFRESIRHRFCNVAFSEILRETV